MKKTLTKNNLQIKQSDVHGYGVFALQDISKGAIIEESPVILVTKGKFAKESIREYLFYWDDEYEAVVTGNALIFNHGEQPNCSYMPNSEDRLMTFTAGRDIKAGEEILIYYGNGWFQSRQQVPLKANKWRKYMKSEWLFNVTMIILLIALVTK